MQRNKIKTYLLVFFVFLFFISPERVFAKRIDYSNVAFGMGFWIGASLPPTTTVTPVPQSKSPSFVAEYGGELLIPIDLVYLRPIYGMQTFSYFSGEAADPVTAMNYTQSAKGKMRVIGGKLSVNMWFSESGHSRIYVGGGGGSISLKVNMNRTYADRTEYAQDAVASTSYWEVHAGWAMFLVQNYSLSIEGGYRGYRMGNLTYGGSRDLSNNVITGDKSVYLQNGKRAEFSSYQPYVIGVLHFNF